MGNAPPRFGRLAILAGGGDLPRMIAAQAAAAGTLIHIVAIEGAAEHALTAAYPHTWVNLGQARRMFTALRGPADAPTPNVMIIAGAVRRPDILRLRPDRGTLPLVAELLKLITAGGDDALLTRAIGIFERQGLTVVGIEEVAPALLLGSGVLGTVTPDAAATRDMDRAADLIAAIGDLDVGQAVAVADGAVLAIEGAEGTDRMLQRLVTVAHGRRSILLKAPKPGQERRVDLPTIGPLTIAAAAPAGVRGIAVIAGSSVGLEADEMRRQADAAGLFLVGRPPSRHTIGPPAVTAVASPEPLLLGLTSRRLRPADRADVVRGTEVVTRLAPFATGHTAVVTRGHVLAVGAAEAPVQVIERATGLSQWGIGRFAGRRGMAVVRWDAAGGPALGVLDRVAAARLAGLALVTTAATPRPVADDWIARATALRLALIHVVSPWR
jgi:DUF1009 family protein